MILKHISILSIMAIIAGIPISPLVRDNAAVNENKHFTGIESTVVAPHVPADISRYYIKPTLCKIIDISEPLYKQLKMCKEQRKEWFKI